MPATPERRSKKEQHAQTFADYATKLHNRLTDIARDIHPDFQNDSVHLYDSTSNMIQENPGLVFILTLDNQLGIRPNGWNGQRIYYVNPQNPQEIIITKQLKEVKFNPGIDFDALRSLSELLKDTPASPLFIKEALLDPDKQRDMHQIELNTPGLNIWEEPVGQGPTMFS